jgi:hypothetical protein
MRSFSFFAVAVTLLGATISSSAAPAVDSTFAVAARGVEARAAAAVGVFDAYAKALHGGRDKLCKPSLRILDLN